MKKRILSIFIAVALLFTVLTTIVYAQTEDFELNQLVTDFFSALFKFLSGSTKTSYKDLSNLGIQQAPLVSITYYVDNSAAPGGDGTITNPFNTIQQGLNVAVAGDTVIIRGDTSGAGRVYTETPSFPNSGVDGAPITLQNYPGEKVLIRDVGTINLNDFINIKGNIIFDRNFRSGSYIMNILDDNNVLLQDVELRNSGLANDPAAGIHIKGSQNIFIINVSIHDIYDDANAGDGFTHCITTNRGTPISTTSIRNLKIINSTFFNCEGDGIQFFYSCSSIPCPSFPISDTILIEGNLFYTTLGDESENGMDIKEGNNIIVRNNTYHGFKHTTCGKSQALVFAKGPDNIIVEGNLIYDSYIGIDFHTENSLGPGIDNVIIRHNVIRDMPQCTATRGMIEVNSENGDPLTNIFIYHNTIVNGANNQIWGNGPGSVTVRNNLFYNCRSAATISGYTITASNNGWFGGNCGTGGTLNGPNDVTGTDPQFVNLAGKDFHLQATSPAIDRGFNLGYPYSGLAPDLGAFEFIPTGPPTCTDTDSIIYPTINYLTQGTATSGATSLTDTCTSATDLQEYYCQDAQSTSILNQIFSCQAGCINGACNPDTTPPGITNVQSNALSNSATITWTTDELSDSTVNYGTTASLGSTVSNPADVTSHSITITGLTTNTQYFFEVVSTDISGNTRRDNNNNIFYTFTTSSTLYNYLEAENGILNTAVMGIGADAAASNNAYIYVRSGVGDSTSPVPEATYTINIPQTGNYRLWLRIYGPTFANDALYIGFDGNFDRVFTTATNVYQWVGAEVLSGSGNYVHNLNAGNHAIYIGHGEQLARADCILVTSNLIFTPTGPCTIPDVTAPVISNVQVSSVTSNSALITWTTDEASNSTVNYGTSQSLGLTASNPTFTTSHSLTLTGLSQNTIYYFEVRSADVSNNIAIDNNANNFYTFRTIDIINPTLDFVAPTPNDGAILTNPPVDVEISMQTNPLIPGEGLKNFTLNFNSVNYALPNLLSCNFDFTWDCEAGEIAITNGGISAPFGKFGDGVLIDTGTIFLPDDDIFYYSSINNINLNGGTIMLWIKPIQPWLTADEYVLLDTYNDATATGIMLLKRRSFDEIRALISTTDGVFTIDIPSISFTQGTWHHIALTYGNGNMELYVDGNAPVTRTYTGAITSFNSNIYLGQRRTTEAACQAQGADECQAIAVFDQFAIYSKIITNQELTNLYNQEFGTYYVKFKALPVGTYTYHANATQTNNNIINSTIRSFSVINDITPPRISNVQVSSVTSNSALTTWTTDELSTSVVEYGTTTALGLTVTDPALVTSHNIQLTGLSSSTQYFFRVSSTDASNNRATDDNNGNLYTFNTLAPIIPTIDFVAPTPNDGDIINDPNVEIRMQLTPLVDLNDMVLSVNSINYKLPTLLSCNFENAYACENGETPTSTTGTSFITGKFGQGILVDSTDSLSYPSLNNINTAEGTIMFWIKPPVFWRTDTRVLTILDTLTSSTNGYYGISITKSSNSYITANIYLDSFTEISADYPRLLDTKWHHIALTYGNGNMELYVDGIRVNSVTYTGSIGSFNSGIYIGSNRNRLLQANAMFDGLKIYKNKLSINDIKNLYDKDFGNYYIKFVNLQPDSYSISATATETNNNIINSPTRSFTRQSCTINCQFVLNLQQGINLISLPIVPSDSRIDVLLQPILSSIRSIYAYDTLTSSWEVYHSNPLIPDTLTTLNSKTAYFIVMNSDASITITGGITNPSRPLSTGWNPIGINNLNSRQIQQELTGVTYDSVWRLNSLGNYEEITDFTSNFDPGAGYWVHIP